MPAAVGTRVIRHGISRPDRNHVIAQLSAHCAGNRKPVN